MPDWAVYPLFLLFAISIAASAYLYLGQKPEIFKPYSQAQRERLTALVINVVALAWGIIWAISRKL